MLAVRDVSAVAPPTAPKNCVCPNLFELVVRLCAPSIVPEKRRPYSAEVSVASAPSKIFE